MKTGKIGLVFSIPEIYVPFLITIYMKFSFYKEKLKPN